MDMDMDMDMGCSWTARGANLTVSPDRMLSFASPGAARNNATSAAVESIPPDQSTSIGTPCARDSAQSSSARADMRAASDGGASLRVRAT
eukprot:6267958-Prymnesium_polylepis.2